jgi:hypothetical protein
MLYALCFMIFFWDLWDIGRDILTDLSPSNCDIYLGYFIDYFDICGAISDLHQVLIAKSNFNEINSLRPGWASLLSICSGRCLEELATIESYAVSR